MIILNSILTITLIMTAVTSYIKIEQGMIANIKRTESKIIQQTKSRLKELELK